jgi:DNA invertase Pin-like site-specific DNA recombinase
MKIYGYCRVSTTEQTVENQKLAILEYARKESLIIDSFISVEVSSRKDFKKRKINELLDMVEEGDTIICAELSRMGRSISEIVRLVDELRERHVALICIKERIHLPSNGDQDLTTQVQLSMFSLLAQVEAHLIRERTKEGLNRARKNGVKLGRRKGSYSSKIDRHRKRIEEMLKMGISKKKVADTLDINYCSLLGWMKRREISIEPDLGQWREL